MHRIHPELPFTVSFSTWRQKSCFKKKNHQVDSTLGGGAPFSPADVKNADDDLSRLHRQHNALTTAGQAGQPGVHSHGCGKPQGSQQKNTLPPWRLGGGIHDASHLFCIFDLAFTTCHCRIQVEKKVQLLTPNSSQAPFEGSDADHSGPSLRPGRCPGRARPGCSLCRGLWLFFTHTPGWACSLLAQCTRPLTR